MAKSPDFSLDEFPSLEIAYDLVVPSHDWAIRRFEATNRRIDNLITFIVTVTLAIVTGAIAIAGSSDRPFTLFPDTTGYIALSIFLLIMFAGMYIRQMGSLAILDLMTLYRHFISLPKGEFRGRVFFQAGKNLSENQSLIQRKAWGATIMIFLFLIEITSSGLWIIGLLSL